MIEVKNLSKFYGKNKAVEDLSFEIKKGEIVGFLGPNGAGKTTTMRILTCFHPATSGEAKVAGFDVFREAQKVKEKIGYLPETPPLYKEMKVRDYLNFVAKIKGVAFSQVKKNTDEVIEKCCLQTYADSLILKLSKGYRQRVGIAQALIHKPEILILDEPTSGLDPTQIIEVRNLIKSLKGEHTILLSTHILPEVSMTCQKVVIINRGRIVAKDSLENLSKSGGIFYFLQFVGEQSDALISDLHNLEEVASVDFVNKNSIKIGLKKDLRTSTKIANLVYKNGLELSELKKETVSLEEIFVKLIFGDS